MKGDLSDQTDALSLSEKKLSRIVELGIAMTAERESDRLMVMVLNGAKDLANADGGTLYTISEDKMLEFKIVQNDSLGISLGGTSGNEVNLPPVAMLDDGGEPNHKNVVSHTVHAGEPINIADAYEVGEFNFKGTRAFDERNGYRSK